MYITKNIPPIMIIDRTYENQNLLSLQLVSFLVGLRNYQHPCTTTTTTAAATATITTTTTTNNNNNNSVINNYCGRLKTLLCSSKFPWARERISSKCIDNLGTLPLTGSPALTYAIGSVCGMDKLAAVILQDSKGAMLNFGTGQYQVFVR